MLRFENVSKSYRDVVALNGVSVDFAQGEIHSILGANGAGKSTLAWLLAGKFKDYSGRIFCDDRLVDLMTRRTSIELGVQIAPQEPALAPDLTINENALAAIGSSSTGAFVRLNETQKLFSELGLNLPLNRLVGELDLSTQQFASIFRALVMKPKLLILDEPPLLSADHARLFFNGLLPYLKSNGVGVILVTHQVENAIAISDRISVIREAKLVATGPASEYSESSVRGIMYSGLRSGEAKNVPQLKSGALTRFVFEVGGRKSNAIAVAPGEVTALTGAMSDGAGECLRSIVGLSSYARVAVGSSYSSPYAASSDGVHFLSADREGEGSFPNLTIEQNIILGAVNTKFWKSWSRQKKEAENAAAQLGLKYVRRNEPLSNLSGGNQQRVLSARALLLKARLYLLEEPDRGIDLASLPTIARTLRQLASGGSAVLLTSPNKKFIDMVADHVEPVFGVQQQET